VNFQLVLRQVRRVAIGGALAGVAYGALKALRTGGPEGKGHSELDDERFQLYAENARDLVYRYRVLPTPGFEYISPSATGMTGFTPEEHYADPYLGVNRVHPEDRHLLEGPRRFSDEPLVLRWYRKDGTLVWTEQHNKPVYDGAGNVVAIEGIAWDITRRKLDEEALRQSEERFRAAFGSATLGMALADPEGR